MDTLNSPKHFRFFIQIIIGIILLGGLSSSVRAKSDWKNRVDPWVLTNVQNGETEFLLFLEDQADLAGADDLSSKAQKGQYVFEQLTSTADRTQEDLTRFLESEGVAYRSYWITNMIWVRGGEGILELVAQSPDVAHIYANPAIYIDTPRISEYQNDLNSTMSPESAEWNLVTVNAPQVWGSGYTGQGTVIGGQDTGYDWDHPALIEQYRGWDGSSADHNYNWHDAIHEGGSDCGANSPEPCDDQTHGTHTMGTMVGDDGLGNQVGMAPGARWIGCRNMNEGWGSPASYSECYQWFLAPTDLNDENPRPDLAPDVINNSWSCPPSEGCEDPIVLQTVVDNLRAAGIVTVHSAGNDGSGCSTINTPAAIYDASFTVGATDSSDNIAGFSSRGPVTVDGSNRLKPDITAPGVGIRSTTRGGGYGTSSGTSMAAPHVAGLVALLISADPDLRGQVSVIEEIIQQTAVPRTSGQDCGNIPGSQIPNHTYGWGRIDAWNAILDTGIVPLQLNKSASAEIIEPGGTLTYTLTITNTHPISSTTNLELVDEIPQGTSFLSASPPYSLDESSVHWNIATLEPNKSLSVELVVEAPEMAGGQINNLNYWVSSDQIVNPVFGKGISTPVRFLHYLQIIYSHFNYIH